MISLLLAVALAAPPAVGMGPGIILRRGSADHTPLPALGAWGQLPFSPAGAVGADVEVGFDRNRGALVTTRATPIRFAVHVDGVIGRRATALVVGVGPGLAVTPASHTTDDDAWRVLVVRPTVHARAAILGPLVGPVVWRAHMAANAATSGLDWTTGVSFGIALGDVR